MIIYPAIDLYEGKAVRLFKGDYAQMTVYNENPLLVAKAFEKSGATHIHLVDLEGAKNGTTPNFDTVKKIKENTSLFCEIGGGVRNDEVIEKYINAGIDRVILGTAAVKDPEFLEAAVEKYGEKIAVGIDIKEGLVAIKGWTETADLTAEQFCERLEGLGVKTIICTDVSKDGAMQGTNHELYKKLKAAFGIDIIASGGVSSLDDIKLLRENDIYGAIIGKAYYTGAVRIEDALEVAK